MKYNERKWQPTPVMLAWENPAWTGAWCTTVWRFAGIKMQLSDWACIHIIKQIFSSLHIMCAQGPVVPIPLQNLHMHLSQDYLRHSMIYNGEEDGTGSGLALSTHMTCVWCWLQRTWLYWLKEGQSKTCVAYNRNPLSKNPYWQRAFWLLQVWESRWVWLKSS